MVKQVFYLNCKDYTTRSLKVQIFFTFRFSYRRQNGMAKHDHAVYRGITPFSRRILYSISCFYTFFLFYAVLYYFIYFSSFYSSASIGAVSMINFTLPSLCSSLPPKEVYDSSAFVTALTRFSSSSRSSSTKSVIV